MENAEPELHPKLQNSQQNMPTLGLLEDTIYPFFYPLLMSVEEIISSSMLKFSDEVSGRYI